MGQPQLPGRGPEILANLLRHPGGCCGVVTWSCAARTRHVSDLFLAGGVGWLLAAAMQDLDCRMLTERTVSIKCVFLSSTIPCSSHTAGPRSDLVLYSQYAPHARSQSGRTNARLAVRTVVLKLKVELLCVQLCNRIFCTFGNFGSLQ